MAIKYNEHISTTALSKLLGISRVAVFNRIQSGKIPAVKVGRNYVIKKSDLPDLFGSNIKKYGKTNSFQGVSKRAALLIYNFVLHYPYPSHQRLICSVQLLLFFFKNKQTTKLTLKAINNLITMVETSGGKRKNAVVEYLRKVILENMVDLSG